MEYYQHDLKNVEDYLHHRPPYLLVERIVSTTPAEIVTEATVSGQEFFLKGHFPGAPIFPGAMMQELTTQSAGILIAAKHNPMKTFDTHDTYLNDFALGVLVKVKQARYKDFAGPGDNLRVNVVLNEIVGSMFDFSATISVDNKPIMRNSFQLTNVKSEVLRGASRAC